MPIIAPVADSGTIHTYPVPVGYRYISPAPEPDGADAEYRVGEEHNLDIAVARTGFRGDGDWGVDICVSTNDAISGSYAATVAYSILAARDLADELNKEGPTVQAIIADALAQGHDPMRCLLQFADREQALRVQAVRS